MSWVASNTKKTTTRITPATGYTRPADWPILPTVNEGDQIFVGLYAVWNSDSNFIALSATGAYTVDWGDGSPPENVASGVQANHLYDYSAVSSAVTSRGYKTCIVTVTPQSGNLTGLNLSKKHPQVGLPNYSTMWLELSIGGVFTSTGLVIGLSGTVSHKMLERVVHLFGTSAVTTMSTMFHSCNSLQSVPLFDTSAVNEMSFMFYNCNSLQSVPLFDTSAVTTMAYMFYNCASLQSVPLFDTSAVTTMSFMFGGCASLQSVPLFDTSAVTTMAYMFYNCFSLQFVPMFGTSAVTTMSYMFSDCYSLQSVPMLDASAVTTMSTMFSSCSSLKFVGIQNIVVSLSVSGCMLSTNAIIEMFDNLATVSGQTITVSNNWGYSALTTTDREIATNKGWVIA